MREYVDRVLKKQVGKPPFVPSMFYGTGGTFTALASMIMAREGQAGQPMWGFRVTGAQIRHLVTDLAQLTLEKRKKIAGLNPARADIIVSGLVIIERIMSHLHVNVVQVHTRGVRDGLLLGDGAGGIRRTAQAGVLRSAGRGSRAICQKLRRRFAARPASRPHRRFAVGSTRGAAQVAARRS